MKATCTNKHRRTSRGVVTYEVSLAVEGQEAPVVLRGLAETEAAAYQIGQTYDVPGTETPAPEPEPAPDSEPVEAGAESTDAEPKKRRKGN